MLDDQVDDEVANSFVLVSTIRTVQSFTCVYSQSYLDTDLVVRPSILS
jgi:hypothetical protein